MWSKCRKSGTGQEQSGKFWLSSQVHYLLCYRNLLANQAFYCVNWISLYSPKSVGYSNLGRAQCSSTQEAKQKYFKSSNFFSFFLSCPLWNVSLKSVKVRLFVFDCRSSMLHVTSSICRRKMWSKTGFLFMESNIVLSVRDWLKLSSVGKSKTLSLPSRFVFIVAFIFLIGE